MENNAIINLIEKIMNRCKNVRSIIESDRHFFRLDNSPAVNEVCHSWSIIQEDMTFLFSNLKEISNKFRDQYETILKSTKSVNPIKLRGIETLLNKIYNFVLLPSEHRDKSINIEISTITLGEKQRAIGTQIPTENQIEEKLYQALLQIQRNPIYRGKKEDTINDGLRDMLNMVFDCNDQTRQGESENRIEPGEVDLLIKHAGIPISIIESVRLSYLDRNTLSKHVTKVLTKYDDNGCLVVNLIIYGMMSYFSDFWIKLVGYLQEIVYPHEVTRPIENYKTGLAESRHAMMIMKRQDEYVFFHIYAIHMKE